MGDAITIAGVSVAGYNGTFTVASVIDATHFTYVNGTTGLGISRRGAVWSPTYPDVLGPQVSQGWDDWGPFYGQTYMAMLGVDSSTVEMASTTRLVSKTAQYMAFYSSVNYWLDNTYDMMSDQLETFRRGVENAPTDPSAIDNVPELVALGFSDALHNWMATYPTAYVIPYGAGQRSDAEANRLVDWCFANNIKVERMASDFSWNGTTFQAGSYVVPMAQALRGLAWNVFSAGTDIETRITQLYASPAAWSHGLLWGADTVEIPRDDATFTPATTSIDSVNELVGGVRDGVDAPADFYSVSLKGVTEDKAILALLRSGVSAQLAEEPFTSTTGGEMPAGSLIFPADSQTAAALDEAGQDAGMWFERNVGVAKPATTMVPQAPKIAILANSVPTSGADTDGVLKRIFGAANVQYVPTVSGAASLENASSNPLSRFNVIYNAGGAWPTSVNVAAAPNGATSAGTTATITTTGTNNLAAGAKITIAGVAESGVQRHVQHRLRRVDDPVHDHHVRQRPAGVWWWHRDLHGRSEPSERVLRPGRRLHRHQRLGHQQLRLPERRLAGHRQPHAGQPECLRRHRDVEQHDSGCSPITGAYPAADKLFLPSSTTYFSATPDGAIVDAQYPESIATTGPEYGYLAGMWLNRQEAANNAAVLVHGTTSADSRYMAYATNPTSRYDAEREWPLIVQAALWSDLTDEGQVAATITASAGANGTISPSGATMVAIGADETYTITPAYGYAVDDVTVDGQSMGAITTFTFHNVAADHAIAASFAVAPMPWKVTLKLSKTTVKVDQKVKFSGSVKNSMSSPATGKVTIQRKEASGGSWSAWRTVKLNTKGNYSLTVKMTRKGTWYFRTMKSGDAQYLTSYSSRRG